MKMTAADVVAILKADGVDSRQSALNALEDGAYLAQSFCDDDQDAIECAHTAIKSGAVLI